MASEVRLVLNAVFVSVVTPRSVVAMMSQMNIELAVHLSREENDDKSENSDSYLVNSFEVTISRYSTYHAGPMLTVFQGRREY